MSEPNPDPGKESSPEIASQPFGKKPRRRSLRWVFLAIAATVLLAPVICWWIMIRMPGESYHGPLPEATPELEQVQTELQADLNTLTVSIGPRHVFRYPALLAAQRFLETEIAEAGYKAYRQNYQVSEFHVANLEARLEGAQRPEEIVVIGAHYDSVWNSPGANDNGTGTVALLSLARHFANFQPDRTLRFVWFVNEEQPFYRTPDMGSQRYAQACRQRGDNVVAMLSLEMLGAYYDTPDSQHYPSVMSLFYPSQGNFVGFVGDVSSRGLVHRAVRAFRETSDFPSEGAAIPSSIEGVAFSDHSSFWENGYPALMVTDTAFFRYPYYHTPQDTVDKIDFERMAMVTVGLRGVVENLVTIQSDE